jgi:hypothetical protein
MNEIFGDGLVLLADLIKSVLPALIAILALLVTSDLSGFREYQKVALSRLDAVSKLLDEVTVLLCSLMNAETFDAKEKQKIEVQLASIQRDLKSLRTLGLLGIEYVKPWNSFKRAISLRQLDQSDFVAKNVSKIDMVLGERDTLDAFIKGEQLRLLNRRRRISESVRGDPYC